MAVVYGAFACAVAAGGAIVGAVDAIATFVSRLGRIVSLAIRNRGGDQRAPCAPEPAYEIYFSRPLIRDFRQAFKVATKELQVTANTRSTQASQRFKGGMAPLAWGIRIGAYTGAAIGVIVGSLVGVLFGVVVFLVAGFVWTGAHTLQLVEKGRRRLRGAHFDCPTCHERSALPVYICPGCGAKHHQLLPGRWGVIRRRCECDLISLPVLESGGRHSLTAECPKCSHVMPGAGGIVPEISIPIIGGPKAGKTALLASVLVELANRTDAGSSRLAVQDDSRAAFDELVGDLRAGRVPAKTLDRDVTPALVAEVRSGASRSALLYAHDVAGERYQQADAVRDMSPLVRARGAIILIDPFSLRAVGAELDGRDADRVLIDPSAEDPQSVVERFIQSLRESRHGDLKKLPVAVVVSKTDALTEADGVKPGDRGQTVRSWLDGRGGGNLARLIEAEFDRTEFFAASALGRLPDPAVTSAFEPSGTLEPFFWLLAENKIAMDSASQSTTETVTEKLSAKEGARTVTPRQRVPLFEPQQGRGSGYGAGLVVAVAIVGGLIGVTAIASKSPTGTNADYTQANNGSGGSGAGQASIAANSGTANTSSTPTTPVSITTAAVSTTVPSGPPPMRGELLSDYQQRSSTYNDNGTTETCPQNVTVGPVTSCDFAANVATAFSNGGSQPGVYHVYSPVTDKNYVMHCRQYVQGIACRGGINASVFIGG